MNLFHVIPDAQVIVRSKRGVYRQAKVYARGEHVYAAQGGGYVRLLGHGGTSCPDIVWEEVSPEPSITKPRVGALIYDDTRRLAAPGPIQQIAAE